jgi:TP901 family phage tail tape measure protein
MDSSVNYIISVSGNAATGITAVAAASNTATQKVTRLGSVLRRLGDQAFALNNISQALTSVKQSIDAAIQPGIEYDSQLSELSAIAGITGKNLKEIGGYARQNAKEFGGGAAKSVESYKLILSQLGPEIAKTPAALKAMGKSVSILSKTLGNDPAAATEVLTSAMNQYQVSLDDPIEASKRMADLMNVMAAAAREGSAELPQIKAALDTSGMAAKMAGVSFEELNATIQVLDKAGKRGAEGGTAIRNTLSILSQGRFMKSVVGDEMDAYGISIDALGDKSLSLAERLKLLKPAINDTALITKMFGRENQNAALALISGTEEIERYTTAVAGTNAAQEQAGIIMGSFAEKMSRIKSRFDDFKISLFSIVQGALPAVTAGVTVLQGAVSTLTLVNAMASIGETALGAAISRRAKKMRSAVADTWALVYADGTWMGMSFLAAGATYVLTAAVKALSTAIYNIPIIGWVVLGISLLIGMFKLLWEKSEKFRQILFGVWEAVKAVFSNIGVVISTIWNNIIKPVFMAYINVWKWVIGGIWQGIQWLWNIITSAASAVADFFTSIWTWITGTFSGIANWLNDNLLQPIKDVFSKLWGFVGAILNKIINALAKPIAWIKGLWNKIFPEDKFKDVGEAYGEGVVKGTKSWADSQKKKKGEAIPGIDSAISGQPAGVAPGNQLAGSDAAGKGTETIVQGGTRNTEININFRNMVETITFSGTLKENANNLRREVEVIMQQVLNQARATA